MQKSLFASVAIALLLGGCGGDDASGPAPAPTATPTPVPTPTPTPTPLSNVPPGCRDVPAETGTIFDQTVVGAGYSDTVFESYYGPGLTGALSRTNDGSYIFREPVQATYEPVPGYKGDAIFRPADEDASTDRFVRYYYSCDSVPSQNYGGNRLLSLYRQGPAVQPLALTYSTIGSFRFLSSTKFGFATVNQYYFGLGSPSSSSALPTATATYSGFAIGRGVLRGVNNTDYEFAPTAPSSVEIAGSQVTVNVTLQVDEFTDLGTYELRGTLDPTTARFTASSADGEVSGIVSGPTGQEVVASFRIDAPNPYPTYPGMVRAIGALAVAR